MLKINQLTGFGAGGVVGLSFVDSATSLNSDAITVPGTAAVGDIAILFDVAVNLSTTTPTNVVPSGWSSLTTYAHNSSAFFRNTISYKKLASGEPGSSVTGMNDDNEAKVMLIFRANESTLTAFDIDTDDGITALTAQTITSSGGTVPLIALGMKTSYGGSVATLTGFDGAVTPGNSNIELTAGYSTQTETAANVTASTVDDGNQQSLVSMYVQLS